MAAVVAVVDRVDENIGKGKSWSTLRGAGIENNSLGSVGGIDEV